MIQIGKESSSDICFCEGECCFRGSVTGRCKILNKAYYYGCSFQKKDRHYTKGKYYPDVPYEEEGKRK